MKPTKPFDSELPKKRALNRTPIYLGRDNLLDWENNNLKSWNGSKQNKELISQFQEHQFSMGVKNARIAKVTSSLRRTCDLLPKALNTWTKHDMQRFCALVNKNPKWSDNTKRDFKVILKSFYKWFEEEDKRLKSSIDQERQEAQDMYTFLRKYVKTPSIIVQRDPTQVIEDVDCQTLIEKGCRNALERAIIALLHESGVRAGELLNMRIKDFERVNKHAQIHVNGKTGRRTIPILRSIPRLELWIEEHPAKTEPNACLWVSKANGHYAKPLKHFGLLKLLRRVGAKADLDKPMNPHWFRHSRATIYGRTYTERHLEKIMGWTIGSKQPKTYCHHTFKDAEREFKKQNGLEEPEEISPQVQVCACGNPNESTAKYCYKCGQALRIDVLQDDQAKRDDAMTYAMEALLDIMKDPDRRKRFEDFLRTTKQ